MRHQLSEAREREHHRANRHLVLIVEGSLDYLNSWSSAGLPFDFHIFVGNLAALDNLGVEVIDREWTVDDKPINLNRIFRDLLTN